MPWRRLPLTVARLVFCGALLLAGREAEAATPVGCFYDDVTAPLFAVSAMVVRMNESIAVEDCMKGCLVEGFAYAGITENATCTCTAGDPTTLVDAAPECTRTCPSGDECGGETAAPLSVYATGGGPLNFSYTVDTDATSITLTPEVLADELFIIDMGYGAWPFYVNATAGSGTYTGPGYIIPGNYTVSVTGTVPGLRRSLTIPDSLIKEGDSTVDRVVCPLVSEPDVLYSCNVSVTLGLSSHGFDTEFQSTDQTVTGSFSSIGSKLIRSGEPLPLGFNPMVKAIPGETAATVVSFQQFVITKPTILHAVELYAMEAATYAWEIVRPSCASGMYCVFSGGCADVCPYDSTTHLFTCAAPNVFCSKRSTCGDSLQKCAAPGAGSPTWASAVSGAISSTGPGGYREALASPTSLYPGDTLRVTGVLGSSGESYAPGDTVDDVATNTHHLANMIIAEEDPVSLGHTCLVINNAVTLTVTDAQAGTSVLSNVTECQRNITDVIADVLDTNVDDWDSSLNLLDPYYVWAGTSYTPNFRANFSVTGPTDITVTFTPPNGGNVTLQDTDDYPYDGSVHTILVPFSVANPGTYEATLTAYNLHNTYHTAPNHTMTIIALYPVLSVWVMAPTAADGQFWVPPQMPEFTFTDSTGSDFPTDASVLVQWNDGSEPETFAFNHTGDFTPVVTHNYTVDGVYTIDAFIYNMISGYNVSTTVTIIEQIHQFDISNVYYSRPGAPARPGFGKLRNQYPMDKNLTFIPQMTQGTVDTYEVRFTENNSLITTFSPADPFNPIESFAYHFSFETFLNLTVLATNAFETVSVDLFVEIVGQVRVLEIDDFSDVTKPGEEKDFNITFESVGAATCLVLDWGMGGPLESYGEETTCKTNFSHAVYHSSPDLDVVMSFKRTYDPPDGQIMFNVTGFAYNHMSVTEDVLMFPVTDIDCHPPIVAIVDQIKDYLSAPEFEKGDSITFVSSSTVNCAVTQKTKKRWEILYVDPDTGRQIYARTIMNELASWNKPELVIPAAFLDYGIYMALYTLTMWEPEVLDPAIVFQRQTETYFFIVKSGLIGKMTPNSISRLKRGPDQTIEMFPAEYSVDPDFPDIKNFTVSWRCRKIDTEEWPAPGSPNPISPLGPGSDGCFGYGPGELDHLETDLSLKGSDFIGVGIYEIAADLGKDTRTTTAYLQLDIGDSNVPIVEVNCITEDLCKPNKLGPGVILNPSSRLAILSRCVDFCGKGPVKTHWTALDDGQTPIDIPAEADKAEMAIETDAFYGDGVFAPISQFHLSASVTNDEGLTGESTYFFIINKPPESSYMITDPSTPPPVATGPNTECLVFPLVSRALLDKFYLTCNGWQDPDNIGIESYKVELLHKADVNGNVPPPTMLVGKSHSASGDQTFELVLPVGVFDIQVTILDKWGAFTVHTAAVDLKAEMIDEDELDAANIDLLIASLAGAGNTAMMTMVIAAQSSVSSQASWLNLTDPSITPEERKQRQLKIAKQNEAGLKHIRDNSNFESMDGLAAAAAATATIMNAASASPEAAMTIGLESRDIVLDIMEKIADGVDEQGVSDMNQMDSLLRDMSTIATGVVLGLDEILGSEGCENIPEIDYEKADYLQYDTDIGYDYAMVVPATLDEAKKCNVKETTREDASPAVDRASVAVERLAKKVIGLMVIGDSKTVTTENGMTMTIDLVEGFNLPGFRWCGDSSYDFPEFCPQGPCNAPVAIMAKEWPAVTYKGPSSAEKLARGSKVLDLDLYWRNVTLIPVEDTELPIEIGISCTIGKRGNTTMPSFEAVNATYESSKQLIPIMYSTFNVTNNLSSSIIQFHPDTMNDQLFLMLSKGRMPTFKNHSHFRMINKLGVMPNSTTYAWFLTSDDLMGNGSYYMGIGEFKPSVTQAMISKPENLTIDHLSPNVSTDYELRIVVSGCYFRKLPVDDWVNPDMRVIHSNFTRTTCHVHHLTSFGSGLVVMPNTIDFSYVFANMGFTDNLTIYVTLIVCVSIFILMLIWARYKDSKDEEKVGATPLPDNRLEDKYLYEIIVVTGNKKEAQTDSLVQFIVSGDLGESDVRTFADEKRPIFRKSSTDAFVMANDKPLGALEYLRIWHDNSGKGPNASWYLSYIVFRDVQTGQKYEFICNDWFSVDKTGIVDRLLPCASKEDKSSFSHLFQNVSSKNIADEHIWFSVFLRSHRSRFTRTQRVGACFSLLFLSMLVNAMFYETVPDQPMSGGLNIGPFTLTQEQLGIGFVSNLIVFPPSFLIVFLFRKSRPRKLRESRIDKAIKTTVENLHAQKVEKGGGAQKSDSGRAEEVQGQKIERKKKFTLPWWFAIIAWLLVAACVAVAVFFLFAYGVMFGQSKATKWITSLAVSFFTSILFVQPFKIFLVALFFSAVCKKGDLDEDDVEEDELSPALNNDQEWMYDDLGERKKLYRRKIDPELIEKLRKKRQNEKEMYGIIIELLVYAFFIFILLTLTYGHRDTNAWLLRENLRHSLIHEGLNDDTDFTGVTDASTFWNYLHVGFFSFLRADRHYNGVSPYQLRGFMNDQVNRIMGYATIRQIRATKFNCAVPSAIRELTLDCSSYSSIVNEEKKDYCASWKLPNNWTKHTQECNDDEFRYATAAELKSLPIWGPRDWYGGGGYVIRLRAKTEDLLERFTYLQKHFWIDKMTRAVLIEFATFNAGTNLFGVATMIADFTPGGGVTPYYRFDGVRLLQHQGGFNLFTYLMEGGFVLFTLYFTIHEARLLWKQKKKYFESYWSYAEIGIIIGCYTAIVLYILRYLETNKALATFNETWGNGYIRLTYAVTLNEYYGYDLSALAFVGILKFIKLLRFNKRVGILSATLRQCWDDLSGFLIAFFLCFFAFVFLFFILLNAILIDFYNFITAIETSFSMMLGKFEFEAMKNAHPLVPILFFVFVLCNSWVLVNLLLTLIIKAFEQVKHDLLKQPNEYEIVDFVWNTVKATLGLQTMEKFGPLQTTSTEPEENNQNDKSEISELPDKMNLFLDYLNLTYFDGTLDLKSKSQLRAKLKNADKPYSRGLLDYEDRRGPMVGE